MSADTQYCTFTVGDLYLGVPVAQVQEVIRSLKMTTVPLAPPAVKGLINLRGQIVTAIDLRTRIGLPARPDDTEAMHVVVRTDDGAVSFVVDDIDDVIESNGDRFERAPDAMPPDARTLVRGVHKLTGRLLLILDVARAVDLDAVAA